MHFSPISYQAVLGVYERDKRVCAWVYFPFTLVALEVVGRMNPPVRGVLLLVLFRAVPVLVVLPLDPDPPELAILVLLDVLDCSLFRTVF